VGSDTVEIDFFATESVSCTWIVMPPKAEWFRLCRKDSCPEWSAKAVWGSSLDAGEIAILSTSD
jgi:hypothetical protein